MYEIERVQKKIDDYVEKQMSGGADFGLILRQKIGEAFQNGFYEGRADAYRQAQAIIDAKEKEKTA